MAEPSSYIEVKTLQRKVGGSDLHRDGEWHLDTCKQCRKPFDYLHVPGSRGARPLMCGEECRRASRSALRGRACPGTEIVSNCKMCSQSFMYTLTDNGRPGRRRKFCSQSCKSNYQALVAVVYRVNNPDAYRRYAKKTNDKRRTHAPLRTWECKFCGDMFESRSLHVRTSCSIACTNAIRRLANTKPAEVTRRNRRRNWCNSNKRRRDWMKGGAEYEKFSRLEIFERDSWRCGICGGDIDRELKCPHPASASLDHILPISRGGSHTRANVQAAHYGCNSKKQNKVKHG